MDGGAYAVKCIPHERIVVGADIYMDGHEQLAAELRWRATDETRWRATPLARGENDRWQAAFRPRRVGAHEFAVCAWLDAWQTFRHDLELKHRAGRDLRLELLEGLQLLRDALARSDAMQAADAQEPVTGALERLAAPDSAQAGAPYDEQVAVLLDENLARAMRALDDRPFETLSAEPYPLWVDRREACCSSW